MSSDCRRSGCWAVHRLSAASQTDIPLGSLANGPNGSTQVERLLGKAPSSGEARLSSLWPFRQTFHSGAWLTGAVCSGKVERLLGRTPSTSEVGLPALSSLRPFAQYGLGGGNGGLGGGLQTCSVGGLQLPAFTAPAVDPPNRIRTTSVIAACNIAIYRLLPEVELFACCFWPCDLHAGTEYTLDLPVIRQNPSLDLLLSSVSRGFWVNSQLGQAYPSSRSFAV